MEAKQLTAAILEGGIRSSNFFNGRLLSGEDLSLEQVATRAGRRRLGQAMGKGIAFGLEVSETPVVSTPNMPVVTIAPGLAVNRQGETLALNSRVDVSLVTPASPTTQPMTPFQVCQPLQSGVYVAGTGVYLLTIAPAEGSEGRAPASGLGTTTVTCNIRYTIEGVQFRLIQLDVNHDDLSDTHHLRNHLAYQCFGIADSTALLSNLFSPPWPPGNLLDELRPNRLTNADIPLALLHWTATSGIRFIDMWSVRRRLTRPATATRWSPFIDDRRVSQGEAIVLQFQDEIDTLRAPGAVPESVVATQYFSYLPAAGILPLAGVRGSRGFDYLQFFSGLTYSKPVFIEGTKVEPLIRTSLAYVPIELRNQELIRLYMVRENMQAIDTSTSSSPQPYLLFASGHIPYQDQGDAHYDVAHWNYGNYS